MKRIITNLTDGFYFKKFDDENVSPEEAIALFDGGIEPDGIAGHIGVELAFLHFGFLQADDVGVQRSHGFKEALLSAGAQAVYVP